MNCKVFHLSNYKSLLVSILAITVFISPAQAADKNWNAGTANWTTGPWSPVGTPTTSDRAIINNGGTAQVTTSSATAGSMVLGTNVGQSGIVTISGVNSKLNLTNTTTPFIGQAGHGEINITSGGILQSKSTLILGSASTGSGLLTVDGAGSLITGTGGITVGSAGTGELDLSNGGAATVTGAITVGSTSPGSGIINVNAASTLTSATLSVGSVGTGILNVSGANAKANVTGAFTIGDAGHGTLNINNGGQVTSGTTIIGKSASAFTSSATLDGATSSWTAGALTVGSSSNGQLSVTGGAILHSVGGTIGGGAGTGVVTVDGSTWDASNITGTASIGVGSGGTGTLHITHGSTVQTSNRLTVGGGGTSGNGTMLIDNSNFTLLPQSAGVQANTVEIGRDGGTGALTIQNGSTVQFNAAQLQLGTRNTQSQGTLIVQNAGTTVTTTGPFTVGQNGAGHFELLDGAILSAGSLSAAGNSAAITSSDMLIDNATLNINGNARLGIGGTFVTTLQNGAVFNIAGDITMAEVAGSVSNLTFAGVGNQLVGNGQIIGGRVDVSGNIVRGGTANINFNQTDMMTFGQTMRGFLNLNQMNAATTILTGDSDFYGTTTISNGTLQLGNGGATGNLANSNIINNSHLVFNHSNDAALAGIITGTGDVTQAGTNTIIFTGNNTYTGGTAINSGTLQLGSGGLSGSVVGPITNNSHLVINRGGFYGFQSVVSGTGDFTKSGLGLTKIMNVQNYTGATYVMGGELRANAANILGSTSGLTVNRGAIFSGNGYNQAVGSLVNNGIVNFFGIGPDAEITATQLSGSGIFGMTTNLEQFIGDHLTVTGTSSGAHRLIILNAGGDPANPASTLEVVSTTDSSTGGAQFSLVGGKVDVGVYAYSLLRGNGSASLPNVNNWYLANVPELISESARAIINTAAGLSNMWFTQLDNLHRRMGQQRLIDPAAHSNDLWVRGYANQENVDVSVSGKPFDQRINGIDVGYDHVLAANGNSVWLGGGFIGYGHSNRTFNDVGSKGGSNAPYLGLYATWFDKSQYYVDLVAKVQHFNNHFDAFDDSGNEHVGQYNNWATGGSIEVGRRFFLGNDGWSIQPQVEVEDMYLIAKNYTTKRDVTVKVTGNNIVNARVGLEGGKNTVLSNGGIIYPYVRVSALDRFSSGGVIKAATLSFNPTLDGPGIEYGAGVIYQANDHCQGYIAFIASNNEHFRQPWGGNAGLRYEF